MKTPPPVALSSDFQDSLGNFAVLNPIAIHTAGILELQMSPEKYMKADGEPCKLWLQNGQIVLLEVKDSKYRAPYRRSRFDPIYSKDERNVKVQTMVLLVVSFPRVQSCAIRS